MAHDLSLTGTSISPIQGARSYSARSSHTSSDFQRSARSGPRNDTPSIRDSAHSTRPRRTKPAMALEFPNTKKLSPRTHSQRATRKEQVSTDYLSLFSSGSNNRTRMKSKEMRDSYDSQSTTSGTYYRPRSERSNSDATSARSKGQRDGTRSSYAPKRNAAGSEDKTLLYDKKAYEDKVPPSTPTGIKSPNQADNILAKREDAAVTIQKWFKRHSQRSKSSEAALKRLLQQKKTEVEETLKEETLGTRQRTEDQKRKQRRDREREERRRAIEELRKSRETKDRINKSLVEEELAAITRRKLDQQESRARKASSPPTTDFQIIENVEEKIDKIFKDTRLPGEMGSSDQTKDEADRRETADPKSPQEESPGTDKSQGLLESLLETIQQLEAEPDQLSKVESSSKLDEKLAWIDEMQSDHRSNVSSQKAHSSVRGAGDFVDGPAQPNTNSILTKAKLDNLMSFLDNVEKQDENYEAAKSELSQIPVQETKDFPESTNVAQLVEAERAASEVTTELLKLRLDVDEKAKSVELLKKALSQQRELTVRHAKEQDKEMNQRLKMQKDQYEATIQRHLSFIDQLIDDKKVLGEKCERLVLEMKQTESKYQKKIKELQETHAVELKKVKDVLSATEKLRREKWIEEKTKTIKEMTVKGLEPEIQRLIAKHKQEVKKLKAIHEAELMQSDERAGQRYIRQTEELREQLEREKDNACTREREMARQRYEKQLEQEEMALQQQRRRMYGEVADEKERLNQLAARQRGDIEKLKEQLEKNNDLASSALTEEYKKSKEEAERRHAIEIETLKERLELEKQAWQETYMKKQEAYVLSKERELKEAVRHDRDSEIETVIEQLEKDMQVQRDQVEKTADNRIKRIREKYESELKEIETLERQTQEKYNNMKVQYSEMEGANMRLKSEITQKEQEVLDIKRIKDKLVEERGNVTDIIRDEFAERLVHIEEENKRMKSELAQMRARHKMELDRINQDKEDELAEVHKRVKAAIVKKEESINQFQNQYEAAVKRADHLEGLLEAQRKQLIGRKK